MRHRVRAGKREGTQCDAADALQPQHREEAMGRNDGLGAQWTVQDSETVLAVPAKTERLLSGMGADHIHLRELNATRNQGCSTSCCGAYHQDTVASFPPPWHRRTRSYR